MDSKRILIVEDEKDMLKLLTTELQSSGYRVFGVSNGTRGFNAVKKVQPHLIILDLMLPGMGGYEVCSRIKADQQLRHIPIIIFSARAGDLDRAMGLECGSDDYLAKPFDHAVLLNKVKSLVEV